jgi:hypothetical protein
VVSVAIIWVLFVVVTVSIQYLAFPIHLVERTLPAHWGCCVYSESGIVDDALAYYFQALSDDAIMRQVCPSR